MGFFGMLKGSFKMILVSDATYESSGWVDGCEMRRCGREPVEQRRRVPCAADWTKPPALTTSFWTAMSWMASMMASWTACSPSASGRCRSCGPSASAGVRSSL